MSKQSTQILLSGSNESTIQFRKTEKVSLSKDQEKMFILCFTQKGIVFGHKTSRVCFILFFSMKRMSACTRNSISYYS